MGCLFYFQQMSDLVPLCFLRIWCRTNNSWLSFKTKSNDRYLINPSGYFNELPDGSLTNINPRTAFPLHNRLPCVPLELLSERKQFANAKFVAVPLAVPKETTPQKIEPELLQQNPLADSQFASLINADERYILLRALESGIVSKSGFDKLAELRSKHGTIGAALVHSHICSWESLLAHCLDIRHTSNIDPPHSKFLVHRKEWELIGEILHILGCITRTHLEYALKIKREGNQAIGQILTAMGACSQKDIERCLEIQAEVIYPGNSEIALIGNLLIRQGIISEEDLEIALRQQKVARQPLGKILVSMGACSQSDINSYSQIYGSDFQSEVDEVNLGNYLLKIDAITRTNLEEALRIQERGRQVLGELLVTMGLCAAEDIENIIQLQREMRDTHKSGIEKLGSILIHCGKVQPTKIDQAVKLQSISRQPLGAILVALGACTVKDVEMALEIQAAWRKQQQANKDRLGEVLMQQGVLSEPDLEEPLLEHMRTERPLGLILVEHKLCSPEQIIIALNDRDAQRQASFLEFVFSKLQLKR